MKRVKFILIVALVALTGLVSCNDDEFLTEHPKYFYTLDNVFTTSSQVDLALVSCYSEVRKLYNLCVICWPGRGATAPTCSTCPLPAATCSSTITVR